jgi:hypothetical protein
MHPPQRTKRTATRVLVAVIPVIAVYLASFALARRLVVLDYLAIDSHRQGTSLLAYYFSKSQSVNSIMFYFYKSLHSMIGCDERTIEEAGRGKPIPLNTPVYVKDLGILKKQGATGF